nr:dihydrofolate reductase [uncultured Roseateles sp.]
MTAIALIAAVARNGAIGRGNDLLFKLPEDQKHFRTTTMGCPVIMGRRTWDSLPARFRPLPGRRNLVITRNAQWRAEGAEAFGSLDAALAAVADVPKVFVIGGGALYALALPRADELHLTEVQAEPEGDTFFPAWERSQFAEVVRLPREADGLRYDFVTYTRT